ncbi:MAG: class I SAM-dependent methyltransferase, partial [Actinomycetota bacterium]|nr:class I SAM-dependent methyltransferase [Actinomycetota bacterium]
MSHGPEHWDARYADADRPWLSAPSGTVAGALAGLAPGRALDVATGTGRHAVWLASSGWQVTAVDFSAVGVAQGRA